MGFSAPSIIMRLCHQHASSLGCSPVLWGWEQPNHQGGWWQHCCQTTQLHWWVIDTYIELDGRQDSSWQTPPWAWNRIVLDASIKRRNSEELRAVCLETSSGQRPLLSWFNYCPAVLRVSVSHQQQPADRTAGKGVSAWCSVEKRFT